MVGLAVLYVSFALLSLTNLSPPAALFKVALITVAVGCLWLVCMLAWPRASKVKLTTEGWIALLSVVPGVLFGIVLPFIGLRAGSFYLIIAVILFPSSIALLLLATRARRAAERWRNTGQYE